MHVECTSQVHQDPAVMRDGGGSVVLEVRFGEPQALSVLVLRRHVKMQSCV